MIHGPATAKLLTLGFVATVLATGIKLSEVTSGCNQSPAVLSADNVAIDFTDTVCAPLENQSAGQPFVDFACTVAEGIEDVISVAETPKADAGAPAKISRASVAFSPVKGVRTINVRVPAAEAPSFMAAHRKAASK